MSGWYRMHRGWMENSLFDGDELCAAAAWIWLIEHAAWRPTQARVKGETIALEVGELCFAQRFLAERWRWSKSRVDRFLHRLEAEGMISTRSKNGATAGQRAGQGQSIITICNYSKYQQPEDGERGNDVAESGATAGQQRGKEEESKKVRRKNIGSEGTRLPADWQPPALTGEAARNAATLGPGRIASEAEKFRNYWAAKAGKDGLGLDWDARWRNWIANKVEWEAQRTGGRVTGGGGGVAQVGF